MGRHRNAKGLSEDPQYAKSERRRGDQVQSLMRAISILNYIAASPEDGVALTDLANDTGLAVSTVHRLLTTLEQERYVRYSHARKRWVIGFQAFATGCAFTKNVGIVGVARPHMHALMEQSGETVNLAILDRVQSVHIAQVECRQIMRVFARPGMRVPLHCSAVGKAILSALSETSLSRLLRDYRMERFTNNTITSTSQLGTELDRLRAAGYATDDEEHHIGLRCVGAPIFDEAGHIVAALSTSGPAARIGKKRISLLGKQVAETARAISIEMAGTSTALGSPTIKALHLQW